MSLVDAARSAFLQVAVIAGIPLLGYWIYQRRRYKRTFGETVARAGLQLGQPRYLVYSLAVAFVGVAALVIWSPPLEPLVRQGSAQRQFVGLGLGVSAITRAFLNGVVQTGLAEELLFRGLITGSLSRRLSLFWANLAQAFIFFLPHLAILLVAPEVWGILPVVFIGALLLGWIRIKSGSDRWAMVNTRVRKCYDGADGGSPNIHLSGCSVCVPEASAFSRRRHAPPNTPLQTDDRRALVRAYRKESQGDSRAARG